MISEEVSREIDPDFIDAMFSAANSAIALGQLYFAWKSHDESTPIINGEMLFLALNTVENIEEAMSVLVRSHDRLTQLYEMAERKQDDLFFENVVKIGAIHAQFDHQTLQRVGELKSQIAVASANINVRCVPLLLQTANHRLPNHQMLVSGLANINAELNQIIFGGKKFRDANRHLMQLNERLRRALEGWRRALN